MRSFACLFVCLLLGSPALLQAQQETDDVELHPSSTIHLAAELARIASRLAGAAAHSGAGGPRHRRHKPAAAAAVPAGPHRARAAVENISKGLVQSVPVDFKGHNLTIVALANDEYVGKHILHTRTPFQAELLGLLLDAVRPGSTVIDAGANMGDFTVFFAAAAGPSGAVYAFEPQARMYQLLCTNMIINGLLQIQPMRNALSYEPGELHLQGTVTDGTAKGMNYKDADRNEKVDINYGGMRLGLGGETVQAITLDSLNLTDVSVIKVDIQGAEKLMFYGAQMTIMRNLPVIAYEAVELNMTAAVDKELNLLQHIRDFNIDAFLKSLGYTSQQAGSDVIMRPPSTSNIDAAPGARLAGRRRMLALPPRKR